MGLYDRPYMRTETEPSPYIGEPGTTGPGLPRLRDMPMWKILFAANVAVFVLESFFGLGQKIFVHGAMQTAAVMHGQVWRLLTSTYIHAGFNHILGNMLGLYFFGAPVERVFGPRRFLALYTAGGLAGSLLLMVAGLVGWINPLVPAVGASGSILALIGTAAVLFPNALVYVYFLVPMRLRTFAALYCAWFIFNITQRGSNYGGDICHLAGIAVGVGWIYGERWLVQRAHRRRPPPSSRFDF